MNHKIISLFCFVISPLVQAIDVQHWQTSNGAKVLFVEARDLPMVDVRVVFDAGSARDGDKFGLAKLTNALIPLGSQSKKEEQISLAFESNGSIFENNSLRDMSIFSLRSLTSKTQLDVSVSTLGDILANPSFPIDAFERIKANLLQQTKVLQQSPESVANLAFMRAVFNQHPYGHPTIGTKKTLRNIDTDDLKTFYQRYYVGKNATVAIMGDLSLVDAKTLSNQVIGKLPTGEVVDKIARPKPTTTRGKQFIPFDSQQTHILLGQIGVGRDDADYFSLYVGNHILGGSGLVSRLSKQIREKYGLTYSVYSFFSPMNAQGYFKIGTQTKSSNTNKALELMQKTLINFIEKGPSEQELIDAKKNIAGSFALSIDSNKKISEYLALIGFYRLPKDYLDTLVDKVNKVTTKDIKDAWKKRINPNNLITILVGLDEIKNP